MPEPEPEVVSRVLSRNDDGSSTMTVRVKGVPKGVKVRAALSITKEDT